MRTENSVTRPLIPVPAELREDYEATPASLAGLAAEVVRSLNHATQRGRGGLAEPSDVYDVIGALKALADRLPQSLNQLLVYLLDEHLAGHIRADDGPTDEALLEVDVA